MHTIIITTITKNITIFENTPLFCSTSSFKFFLEVRASFEAIGLLKAFWICEEILFFSEDEDFLDDETNGFWPEDWWGEDDFFSEAPGPDEDFLAKDSIGGRADAKFFDDETDEEGLFAEGPGSDFLAEEPRFSGGGEDFLAEEPTFCGGGEDFLAEEPRFSGGGEDFLAEEPTFSGGGEDFLAEEPTFSGGGEDFLAEEPTFSGGGEDFLAEEPRFSGGGEDFLAEEPTFSGGGEDFLAEEPTFSGGGEDFLAEEPTFSGGGEDFLAEEPTFWNDEDFLEYIPDDLLSFWPNEDFFVDEPEGIELFPLFEEFSEFFFSLSSLFFILIHLFLSSFNLYPFLHSLHISLSGHFLQFLIVLHFSFSALINSIFKNKNRMNIIKYLLKKTAIFRLYIFYFFFK